MPSSVLWMFRKSFPIFCLLWGSMEKHSPWVLVSVCIQTSVRFLCYIWSTMKTEAINRVNVLKIVASFKRKVYIYILYKEFFIKLNRYHITGSLIQVLVTLFPWWSQSPFLWTEFKLTADHRAPICNFSSYIYCHWFLLGFLSSQTQSASFLLLF